MKMKIVVADDDPLSLAVLVTALKGSYEVVAAEDGHAALRAIREHAPDLVLLDVMMPELDGLEVCRRVRADPALADTPVIFVTAVDSEEGEQEGLELGAADYITKPVNLRIAKLRVRNQLAMRRQQKEIAAQNEELLRQKEELEETLGRVKRLEGILSICMFCKKIRTGDDAWQQLEGYISAHTDALFSHGLCPACYEEQTKLI
jgi:DNA-binding response OmpR family regulator